MTTEEIGQVLDFPVRTVRSHLHRGRRQLGDLDGWADSLRESITRNRA